MKTFIALATFALALPAVADTFKCNNDTDKNNARWHGRVSMEPSNESGRVPGFLLIHNAHKDGSIVATTDRRRIKLGHKNKPGTSFSVLLSAKEKEKLLERADKRVNLVDAERVTLWIDFELNEEQHNGQKAVAGKISYSDDTEKEIYSADLTCEYAE